MKEESFGRYTDTAGYEHWYTTGDWTTGGVIEHTNAPNKTGNNYNPNNYSVLKVCPKCGRKLTDNPLCECGQNNASIMF